MMRRPRRGIWKWPPAGLSHQFSQGNPEEEVLESSKDMVYPGEKTVLAKRAQWLPPELSELITCRGNWPGPETLEKVHRLLPAKSLKAHPLSLRATVTLLPTSCKVLAPAADATRLGHLLETNYIGSWFTQD